MDLRENILIILILILTGAYSVIVFSNGVYKATMHHSCFFLVTVISFLICLLYLISQFSNNSSLKDKLEFVGDNSKFFCIGLFVIFVIIAAVGSFEPPSEQVIGHVDLDEAHVSVVNNGEKYIGYWVNTRTGEKLEDEYQQQDPTANQAIEFDLHNIKWEKEINETKLQQAINYKNRTHIAVITLYDSDNNYINEYESYATVNGSKFIISGDDAFSFDKAEMDITDVKYVEVKILLENTNSTTFADDYYNFYIVSNKYKLN